MHIKAGTFVKTAGMDDYKEAHEVPELRVLFGFRDIPVQPQYFASLDQRLLAVTIDYVLITALFAIIIVPVLVFQESKSRFVTGVAAIALIPLAKILYSTAMESSKHQATLGKSLLGLKVCDESGGRMSTGRALIRNLSKIVSKITLGIGYLSGFFDRKQQCLGGSPNRVISPLSALIVNLKCIFSACS
jgi:uncharacterized RDD family membrane protein YckC